jgi:hypothetical protein
VFSHTPEVNWKGKTLSGLATMALAKIQLRRISQGKSPKVTESPFWALIIDQVCGVKLTKRYKKHHEDKTM